jgi:hypothetical protein
MVADEPAGARDRGPSALEAAIVYHRADHILAAR